MKRFISSLLICAYTFTLPVPGVWAADIELESGATGVTVEHLEGGITNITAAQNAIAQFSRFNTAAGDVLNITILGADGSASSEAAALFNINQGSASEFFGVQNILGWLTLVNTYGFNFAAGSATNVDGGLLASTLAISNADFMAGRFALSQDPSMDPGYILNQGEMTASRGSFIALVGGAVRNEGTIHVPGGQVALASGKQVTLGIGSGPRAGIIDVLLDAPIDAEVYDFSGNRVNDAIGQTGSIQADGGLVILSAAAKAELFDRVINHTGIIEARSLEERGGRIVLSGGTEGLTRVTGTVDASASVDGTSGMIDVRGGDIEVAGDAVITAAGRGADSDGGRVIVMAERDAVLADRALIDVRGGDVSGDGGFAEFSGKKNLTVNGGGIRAEAVNGEAGSVLLDPAVLNINVNNFTGGANWTYLADETINVAAGVIISTRQASGDHATSASTGDSGDLTLTAPNINLGVGSKLLSFANSGFDGGDISLIATHSDNSANPLINLNSSTARITLDGATVKGDKVTMHASATSSRSFADTDNPFDMTIGLLNVLAPAGASLSQAEAEVLVKSGSVIEGSDVSLKADATTSANVLLLGSTGSLAYGESDPTAKVTVQSGATVNATGDLDLVSTANSTLDVNALALNLGTRGGAPLAVTFAGSDSEITSSAKIDSGATVNVDGDLKVQANMTKNHSVSATGGAYSDGVLGIGVAISNSTSTTTARLDGTADVKGDVTVEAISNTPKNDTSANSAAGSGLAAAAVIAPINGAVNAIFDSKKPSMGADAAAQPIGLAASFALAEHSNNATAAIGSDATVTARGTSVTGGDGDITVQAKVSEVPETSAVASVDSANMLNDTKKNVAIAAAVVVGDFVNVSDASIDNGATVDAAQDLTVHAETVNPYQIQWHQINSVFDIFDKINPNLGVQNGFFTSWAQSSATGEDVGIAGSVNVLTLDNTSRAKIAENAQVNQRAAFRTGTQTVSVTSKSDIETLNISGNFGLNPVATGGAKGGIGVSYLEVNYNNNVSSVIEKGAAVYGDTLAVTAETVTKNISIAESGGKAGRYGANGVISQITTDDETLAKIDDGATILTGSGTIGASTDTVLVKATDEAKILNVSGAVSKGGNVGIGMSVAINEINRNTQALIGNRTGESDDTGTFASDGDTRVEASNTGTINAYSLAAAVVMPDATVPGAGTFGIGLSGDVSVNTIRDDAEAYVRDADITEGEALTLSAKNDSRIEAMGGSVTINTQTGQSIGLAGSYGNNDILSNAKAYVDHSAVDIDGDLSVNALTDSEIFSITASGSGGGPANRSIASSVAYNDIKNHALAYVTGQSDIKNADAVSITASDDSEIFAVAGGVGFGGKSGSGSGTANNKIKNEIKAYSENSDINAAGIIHLSASTLSEITAYAASIGAASAGTSSGSSTSDNEIENITEAGVKGKKNLGTRSDSDITIEASDESTILVAAGNISASGQSGHGRSVGVNDIDNEVRAYADSARLDSKGRIELSAESDADMQVITVGGTGAAGNALAAGIADNDIRNIIETRVTADSDIDATGDITLTAKDDSILKALGGVVSGGGKTSVGSVTALNDIGNSVTSRIDKSAVTSGGVLTVHADSTAMIDSIAATGSGTPQSGLAGSVTLNQVENTVEAKVQNSADVDAANGFELKAKDGSTINSISGAIVGAGSNSLGGAVATNDISNTVNAFVEDSSIDSSTGSGAVLADSTANIQAIAVSGAGAGTAALAGSVVVNDLTNTTQAYLKGAHSTVDDSLTVAAKYTGTTQIYGGALAGGGTAGLGGSAAVSSIDNTTKAFVTKSAARNSSVTAKGNGSATISKADGSGATETISGLAVIAESSENIDVFMATAAAGGTGSLAGTVSTNFVSDDTQAYIEEATVNSDNTGANSAQAVKVRAHNKTDIDVKAGGLAFGGTAGIGGTSDTSLIANTTKAYIQNVSALNAEGDVEVKADTDEKVNSTVVSGAFAGNISVSGSVSVIDVDNTNEAYVQNSTVKSKGSLKVLAEDDVDIDAVDGSASVGGTAGFGASVVLTSVGNSTTARMTDSNTNAKGTTEVNADSANDVNVTAVSGTLGLYAGIGGAISVNTIETTTQSYINETSGQALVNQDTAYSTAAQDVTVKAKDYSRITAKDGNFAAGGVGLGASIDVSTIKNTTTASLGNNTTTDAGRDVLVKAESDKAVSSTTISAAGGAAAGVSGAVSIINIGSALSGDGSTAASSTSTVVNNAVSGGKAGDRIENSTAADAATAKTDAQTAGVSVTDEFNQSASVSQSTTASIGNNAVVRAGSVGDIRVDADDTTAATVNAGSVAGAMIGVGGAVAIVELKNRSNATVGSSADLSAGDDVVISADGRVNTSNVTTIAGAVGSVGLGAAVTHLHSDNDATASIGTGTVVRKADRVEVLAETGSDLHGYAYGAALGSAAVGVVIAETTETGTTDANLQNNVKIADAVDTTKTVNDLLVQGKTNNTVQAYAAAAAGGILAGSGSVSTAKANPTVNASIGHSSDIDTVNDIQVKTSSYNSADADSLGIAVGGLTVGVALATTEAKAAVTSSVANGASAAQAVKLTAGRDVIVTADSDENANSYAKSAAGALIGGSGSDSTSTTSPNVKASIGDFAEVDSTRDTVVNALSKIYSYSRSEGVAAGGLAVGVALSNAVAGPLVQAWLGNSAKIRAKRNANILASLNFDASGNALTGERVKSLSNASAGALIGGTGTNATLTSNATVSAWTGTSSLLDADNDASVRARAHNSAYTESVGKANGLLAGGATLATLNMNTSSSATVGGSATVDAGHDADIASYARSDAKSSVTGGAGQDIVGSLSTLFTTGLTSDAIPSIASGGGASANLSVTTLANTTTGSSSTVKAGNDADIRSEARTKVDANTYMSSTGVFVADAVAGTDVYVDSDAYTTIGSSGKVEANTVSVTADNQTDVKAVTQADVHADIAAGFGTAITRIRVGGTGDPSEAKVTLETGAQILAAVKITLEAINKQLSENLLSKAVVKAYGTFTSTATTLADGTANVNSKIETKSGTKLTTGELLAHAETGYFMDRVPESTADTIVTRIVEKVRTVTREVCSWMPWPLDDLCETITEEVIDLVAEFDFSVENAKTAGSGVVLDDSISMSGDIYNIGGGSRSLTINADGTIAAGSNVNGQIVGNDFVVGDIVNTAMSKYRFLVPNGQILGNAVVHLNKLLDAVTVVNHSMYNLVFNKIDMISTNGGEPDFIYRSTNGARYATDTTINPSSLDIENKTASNITFNEAVKNFAATFKFVNRGGNILQKDNNVVFESKGIDLRADNASLGSFAQRLNVRLYQANRQPDGTVNTALAEIDAYAYADIYLSVKGVNTLVSTAGCASCQNYVFDPSFVGGNVNLDTFDAFGNIDVRLERGELIDYKRVSHDVDFIYGVDRLIAGKDVTLAGQTGVGVRVDDVVQSGLLNIDFTVDGTNFYNHEAFRDGDKVRIKDMTAGGGKITITGNLQGSGTLKALDGYSRFSVQNANGRDLELGDINVDQRINKTITVNSDTNVQTNEYGQVKVETFGHATGGITANTTASGSDLLLAGQLLNSSGTTSLTSAQGNIRNSDTDALIKAMDIALAAANGALGTNANALKTDLTGGKLDASAKDDIDITETDGTMVVGTITSTAQDVTLTASAGGIQVGDITASGGLADLTATGAITDGDDPGTGEFSGAEADITAKGASLKAGSGIGTLVNGLETRLSDYTGASTDGRIAAEGGTGGVFLANQAGTGAGLTIGSVTTSVGTRTGITAQNGIQILSGSPLTVDSAVSDSGGGDITLAALGSAAADDLTLNANVTASGGNGNITLAAGDSIVQAGTTTVEASGSGDIRMFGGEDFTDGSQDQDGNTGASGGSITQANGARVTSANGRILADAASDVAVASMQTGGSAADALIVRSRAASVYDAGDTHPDLVAQNGTATIQAVTGIGSNNALETSVKNLSAVTDTGNIRIDNTGGMTIVNANGVDGVSITDAADTNGGDEIVIRTFSPMTVAAGTSVENHAGGDITLNALGATAADDLTLNGDVITDGGNGNILLTSGDTTTIADGVTVSAEGTGNITVASGEDFTDGLLDQDGNTGVGGGDIIMGGTAVVKTDEGNILMDAADDFLVGVLNADGDNDGVRGDVTTFSRSGSTLDANGPDVNIIADELNMTSGGSIGAPGDPLDLKVNVLTAVGQNDLFFHSFDDIVVHMSSINGQIELTGDQNIFLGRAYAPNGELRLSAGSSILALNDTDLHLIGRSTIALSTARGVVGTAANRIRFQLNQAGNVLLAIGGADAVTRLSANLVGNVTAFSVQFLTLPQGLALYNGIAIGGAPINFLTASRSWLQNRLFPASRRGVSDGRFAADMPGYFDTESLMLGADTDVDVSALDETVSGPITSAQPVRPARKRPAAAVAPAPVAVPVQALEPAAAPSLQPTPVSTAPLVPTRRPLPAPAAAPSPAATSQPQAVIPQPQVTAPILPPGPPQGLRPIGAPSGRLFQVEVEEEAAPSSASE